MNKIINLIKFILSNFGPMVVYYSSNHFFGIRSAIATSFAWCLGEVLIHKIRKTTLTPFFKFSSAITLTFGLVDLLLQRSLLFKYEAATSNLLVGLYFASSLFGKKPLIQEFAEIQGRVSGNISPDGEYYFKFLTVIWSLYLWIKAGFYAWIASRYTLEEGLLIRGIVGNTSFYGLLVISIFGSKPILYILSRLRLLPSTRPVAPQTPV